MAGIYFVGAHAVGKTTLVHWVRDEYKLPTVTEVARIILSEMESNLHVLRLNVLGFGQFQTSVLERQYDLESCQEGFYVADKAFDTIAYAAEHSDATYHLLRSDTFRKYTEMVRKGLVFFIRPHRSLMSLDLNDGVRETVNWDDVVRIDGMTKLLLEFAGVRYVTIGTPIQKERINIVRNCVESFLQNS